MNILLIIEGTYPWYRGGVSEWVYQYLNALENCNFKIIQIATDEFLGLDPKNALYPFTDNIIDFKRISPPQLTNNWQADSEEWYQNISDVVEASITGNEVIHVTNTGFAGWLGAHLSKQFNIPLLLTEHAIYWKEIEKGAVALECGYKIPDSGKQKLDVIRSFKEIASSVYSAAHQIVTVSESNIPYQKKLGAKHIQYTPNGISESWLFPFKKRNKVPVIGWVGRCAEMKNPLKVFQIAQCFRNSELRPVFRMLLSDANEKPLQQKVNAEANFYPEVELVWNQPAKEYYKGFDFLLITSHNESQPLVMLEALANKVLPVGWQVGDLTRKYGLVLKKGQSIQELINSIENVWNEENRLEQLVDNRFEYLKNNHIWDNIFDQYLSVLNELKEKATVHP